MCFRWPFVTGISWSRHCLLDWWVVFFVFLFWWFGWFLVGGFVVSGGKLQQEQTSPCSLCPSSGSSGIKQQKWDTTSQGGQVGSRIDHWCWWCCFKQQAHSRRSPKNLQSSHQNTELDKRKLPSPEGFSSNNVYTVCLQIQSKI